VGCGGGAAQVGLQAVGREPGVPLMRKVAFGFTAACGGGG
jgi:hypothetical protein